MKTKFSEIPPMRRDLMEKFGFLSFQCIFINMDVVGIRFFESNEIIAIQYRGGWKCGMIYEGEKFSNALLLEAYNDAPINYNDLEEYEKTHSEFIEILIPRKDNYVFITEKEVQKEEIKKP